MVELSLSQASKTTGVSKTTLSRWIKKGDISAKRLANGGYQIDASELDRVLSFKNKGNNVTSSDTPNMVQTVTPSEDPMLHREIELLNQRLSDKDGEIEDLRQRLDLESDERRKLTLMLVDNRPKRSLLQRMFG